MNRKGFVLSQSAEEEFDLFDDYKSVTKTKPAESYERSQEDDSVAHSIRFNEQSSYTPAHHRGTITFSDIKAKLTSPESKVLLHGVTGLAKPGELMAIMGESGAGKTTLLNIIGGRSTSANISTDGVVQINGVSLTLDLIHRFVGFVYQEDIFPSMLTVREYLWFHAKLRMNGDGVTDRMRYSRVDALLTELNLKVCANTLIGDAEQDEKTLSGGERKRLSLASELVVNPVLLFLDEPTSGLDSFLAESVVLSLKALAKQAGKTVVFTVHQPSSQIFSYFDRLLLLSNGKICFQGTTAEAASFFAAPPIFQPCPKDYNPADFYMDVICRRFRGATHTITEAYTSSSYSKNITDEVYTANTVQRHTPIEEFGSDGGSVPATVTQQLQIGIWRAAKVYYRNPEWVRTRTIESFTYPIIIGFIFFGLSLSAIDVMNRCGLLIQISSANAWAYVDQFTTNLPTERAFVLRECAVGLYSPWIYFASRQSVELPFIGLLSVIATTIIYVLPAMYTTTGAAGYFISICNGYLIALVASSFGYVFGFWTENYTVVASVCRPIIVAMFLCNGFYINIGDMPDFISWARYLSFFYYGTENFYIAEWANVTLPGCGNETAQSTGNPLQTINCFHSGEEVLHHYAFDASNLGRNFGLLITMAVLARVVALIVLTYRTRRAITPKTT